LKKTAKTKTSRHTNRLNVRLIRSILWRKKPSSISPFCENRSPGRIMCPDTESSRMKKDFFRLGTTIGFFILFYLYIWKRIDPALAYQDQEPVFFFGCAFFRECLNQPGGIAKYISAFLSQFYLYPWAGALAVTAVAWLCAQSVLWIVKGLNGSRRVQVIHLFPAILLLMLHSNAKHPLYASVGYLAALLFFNCFIRFAPRKTVFRSLFFVILAVVLYAAAGGPFLLFSLLCFLLELFRRDRPPFFIRLVNGVFFLLTAAAIPFLFRETAFMMTLKNAYTAMLPLVQNYRPGFTPALLYAFPLLLVPAECLVKKSMEAGQPDTKKKTAAYRTISFLRSGTVWASLFRVLLILTAAAGGAFASFDPLNYHVLRVDYYARRGMWPQVIQAAKHGVSEYGLVSFHVNRAIQHLGMLPDRMFSFPQTLGIDGLFFPGEFRYLIPLQCSDLYFDLGHVNEAQHWAHEAIALRGETAWNLQRLVQTHLVRGEKEAADGCLSMLRKTLFQRNWAERYERMLAKDSLAQGDETLRRLRSVMPDSDFVVNSEEPYLNLNLMVSGKKPNRMAFEYLMASYLLEGKVGSFISRLKWLKELGYPRLPVHYEEALIMYLAERGALRFELEGYSLNSRNVKRFKDFCDILDRHRGNRHAAAGELKRFYGDTYWFYLTYYRAALAAKARTAGRGRP